MSDTYGATREVRFGVVLYGGVSLAIYINGVVQELFRLVRATAPQRGSDTELRWPDESLRGSEHVYRELGRRLDHGVLHAPDPTSPVRTRFVIDLLSGASAGGINGVFLAKALVADADLTPLEELWVDKGDIRRLLHDAASKKDLRTVGLRPGLKSSLLNSRWMYTQLLQAIAAMRPTDGDADQPTGSPYVDALDLWVTTTDLEGRIDVIDSATSAAGAVQEASNRALLHFSFAGPELNGGEARNDFADENNAMLAFAARATSSFPAAFEPVRLADADAVIDALKFDPPVQRPRELHDFFPRYPRGEACRHSFADGGYLDNKPFEQILRTLPLRRSTLPVDRKILYIEPDPGSPPLVAEGADPERPNLLATVLAAVTLPRKETIGDEVAAIRRFGSISQARSEAYRALTRALDEQLARGETAMPAGVPRELAALTTGGDLDGATRDRLSDVLDSWSPTSAAYRTVRDASVAADIAAYLARVIPGRPQDAGSDTHRAMTKLVERMRRDAPLLQSRRLRQRFDSLYALRRINFLQKRAIDAACDPGGAGIAADETITTAAAHQVRRALDRVFVGIRLRTRDVRRPRSMSAPNPSEAQIRAVLDALRTVGIDLDPADTTAATPLAPLAPDALVEAYESDAVKTALLALLEHASEHLALGDAARDAWAAITSRDLPPALRRELQRRWVLFRFYDEVGRTFDELPGESSNISILRISPLDTAHLVPDLGKRYQKLAGSAVGHFGGFFDDAWRRNDILWGRLDAAERIIDALVPPEHAAERADLVGRAQQAILREAWDHVPTRQKVLAPIADIAGAAAVAHTDLPEALDPTRHAPGRTLLGSRPRTPTGPSTSDWMGVSARALRVANDVTTDLSVGALDSRRFTVAGARVMKFGANVLEFLTGQRLKTTILKNLLVMITLIAGAVGLIGLVADETELSRTGWTVFAAALVTRVVADAAADRIAGRRGWLRWLIRVTTLVFVVGAIAGVIVLHDRYPGWRPMLYTVAPSIGILIVLLVSNRRFPPWKAALAALFGTALLLTVYGIRHLDLLEDIIRGWTR